MKLCAETAPVNHAPNGKRTPKGMALKSAVKNAIAIPLALFLKREDFGYRKSNPE